MSKPSSSSNPTNWLDRLRSSKGFPLSPDLDLDHFLSSSNPNPNKPPKDDGLHLAANLMSDVLSDLFVIGDNPPKPPKKTSRKQRNPNHVAPPSSSADAVSPSSADNSVAEAGRSRTSAAAAKVWKVKMKTKTKREGFGSAESDLAGFSRTEVTVIDTSSCSPGWKSEKVVFRKGVVWKVRSVGRKKRKVGSAEKPASGKEKSRSAPAAAVAAAEEVADKRVAFKDSGDQIIRLRRRPKFVRSPRVLATKHPSGFRPEAIGTTSKKNGSSDPRRVP